MQQIKINLPDVVGKGYGEYWRFRGRYRVCKGGRASKKSKTTALNFIVRLMKMPQSNLLVVRATLNTLRDSCWADLRWAAMRLGVAHLWRFTQSPLGATFLPTGQQIVFRGLDDPQKLASIACPVGHLCFCWVEEAFEIKNEDDFDMIDDCIRGELPDGYFKQITLTFNPWSADSWLKRRFFDVDSPDVLAITTTYRENEWLDAADLRRFDEMRERNPARYRVAGLGEWGIDGEQVFEEWRDEPRHYRDRVGTHVIEPFPIPREWRIYRGFDFGYARPFAVGWFAADGDGRLYHFAELYGCTSVPNEGVKWSPDRIFDEVRRIEREHPDLQGREIFGVADPSIWDASRGESVAEMAAKRGVYFERGDNCRIPGWMQVHRRLQFDENGVPMLYVFSTCRQFRRTMPLLRFDRVRPEDVDTDGEDHIADMLRYVCMARPMAAKVEKRRSVFYDPLAG